MKRKVKKMAGGGYGRFVEDKPKSIEEMKEGIAAGAPAEDDGMRPGRNLALEADETPKPKSRAKPKAENETQAERRMAAIGDKYKENKASSQSFPTSVGMESGSAAMKRGRASTDGSGSSPLDKYMRDKETRATRDKRKMDLAVERVKAGVGYKSGGSASSRADGCAIRGKTRGKMY
jgi:hypothetical protein